MNIVVTGSIAYDYLMRFPGSFKQHILTEALHQVSLSFLVDDMTKHWGGVAANIAFTMAKLGLRPRLMGTVGRDFSDYRDWLEQCNVDTSTVRQFEDVFTASFFCNTDNENNQIASFYSGAMARARDYRLADLDFTPDLVIISPNDPLAMTQYTAECRTKGYKFVYDPSQQIARMDGETLARDLQGAYAMVINKYESNLIHDKTGMTIDDLRSAVKLLVVTHGPKGSDIYADGDIIHVPAFPTERIIDPTGAGDAYRGGLIAGLMRGLSYKIAGEIGSLCATYALEYVGTQNHHYTIEDFVKRFREHFDDEGALDIFLSN
jgi:adenosine kinase